MSPSFGLPATARSDTIAAGAAAAAAVGLPDGGPDTQGDVNALESELAVLEVSTEAHSHVHGTAMEAPQVRPLGRRVCVCVCVCAWGCLEGRHSVAHTQCHLGNVSGRGASPVTHCWRLVACRCQRRRPVPLQLPGL